MQVPGTIAHTTVVRADALAVGDIIPGGNSARGHEVLHVKSAMDTMLGHVIRITVRNRGNAPGEEEFHIAVDYTFRPYDRMHVER